MLSKKEDTKILIVNFSGRGGLAHHVYFLCNALAQLGLDFTLLTTRDFELTQQCTHFRCETALLSPHRGRSRAGKGVIYGLSLVLLLIYIRKLKPRVVHLQELRVPSVENRLLRYIRKRGVKVIFTAHDIVNTDLEINAAPPALRKIYHHFDCIVAHTEENKMTIARAFHVDTDRIRVLPVGDYTSLSGNHLEQRAAKKSLGIAVERKVVLFFGYIRKYKGLHILLEALSQVRRSIPDIFLIIAGETKEDFDVYRQLIEVKGLCDIVLSDVRYIPLEQMRVYFAAADVVVLPYLRVFQSGLVRLAYAYKRPVIATRVGDLPIVVEHEKTGYLIPPNSVDSLTEVIKLAFSDSERLRQMGEYAYCWMREKFSWGKIARDMARIYASVLGGGVELSTGSVFAKTATDS